MIESRSFQRELLVEKAVSILNGAVAAQCHSLARATIGLAFVGMFQKQANHLDAHQLLHLSVVFFLKNERIIFNHPLTAAQRTLHLHVLLHPLGAEQRKESRFLQEPFFRQHIEIRKLHSLLLISLLLIAD